MKHNFTGKLYIAAVAGQRDETCLSLQQAIYHVYHLTRSMIDKQAFITLPCGTVLEWDGHNWFNKEHEQ